MKLEFSSTDFRNYSDIILHENMSSGSRVVLADGQRHDEANSRFSDFCERA